MNAKYFLVEIDGDELFLRGYVEGFFRARGVDIEGIYFGSEYGLDDQGFLSELETFFGLKVEHNLLVIREEVLAYLEEAMSRLPERWRLSVTARRQLKEIKYPFKAKTANVEVAQRIKNALANLPVGSRVEEMKFREEKHADDFETAAYAPQHPYEYRVSGILCGEIEPTLKAFRLLSEFEQVSWGKPSIVSE